MSPITPEWASFFAAEIGAAATLTGLVVVAISINLSRILSYPHLPARAAEALITLASALVLMSLWLIPQETMKTLGLEALAIGLIGSLMPIIFKLRAIKTFAAYSRLRRILRVIVDFGAGLIFLTAAVLLLKGNDAGLTWGAAGVIFSFVAGVLNAWVLLVEIMR